MRMRAFLIVDAVIDGLLGIALLLFSPEVWEFTGIPGAYSRFYPNLLGAVLLGICISLIIEARRKQKEASPGLGFRGSLAINFSAGVILSLWLIFGHLPIPFKGIIVLGVLSLFLLVFSFIKWYIYHRRRHQNRFPNYNHSEQN
ncbi:hypothetical protein [Prolixibacter sp. NT017]|uniref:hypothetical protein n=1 Tax=Prolixibacter sp. NT017 TaxID=2652390 RepID=UPI001298EEDC|nr:hypothetical protein [Prolixibacter sp. NT017]